MYDIPHAILKNFVFLKGTGQSIRNRYVAAVHKLEMQMRCIRIAGMTDPAYYIPCLYPLTNRNLNRACLKMNKGGIYIAATV